MNNLTDKTTDTTSAGSTQKPPRGSIGVETYAAVRKLIDAGMNKGEACAHVAAETGRSAATVTTTYYRIAKGKPGGGGVRKSARTAQKQVKRATKATGAQTERLAQDARAAIEALHKHVTTLEAQLKDLSEKSQELDKLKKLIGKL